MGLWPACSSLCVQHGLHLPDGKGQIQELFTALFTPGPSQRVPLLDVGASHGFVFKKKVSELIFYDRRKCYFMIF